MFLNLGITAEVVDIRNFEQADRVEITKTGHLLYAENEDGDYFELQRVQNNENRVWVDYSDIPQSVKDAAVL